MIGSRIYFAPAGSEPGDPSVWTLLGQADTVPVNLGPPDDQVWYLAVCLDCVPILPQPFSVRIKRDDWIFAHKAATGHRVMLAKEVHG